MRISRTGLSVIVMAAATVATSASAAAPSRQLDDYVLLALRSLTLKNGGQVDSGHVAVNDASGYWLSLGRGTYLADGTAVVGDAVRGKEASVYDLYTNRVLPGLVPATIRGVGPLPTGPLPLVAPLPPLPASTPGSGTLVVSGQLVLPPGAHGDLVVRTDGHLQLTGGVYDLRSLRTGRRVRIESLAPTILNIAGMLRLGNESTVGPTAPPLIAGDLRINLAGPLVILGSGSSVVAELYAPAARLRLGRGLRGIGQFVAQDISSDHSTRFSRGACGNGVVEPGEDCDPPDGLACDARCRLVLPGTTSTLPSTTTTSTTTTSTTTTTASSTTTSTTTSSTTTSTTESSTTLPPSTTTTSTTLPPAICGNREVEFPEECDPPGSACPPDGLCQDDCTCLFGGGS